MKNNKIKAFIMLVLVIIIMISSNVYASTNEISQWKVDYLQSDEKGKVTITGIELYLGQDLTTENSVEIQKGDIIEVVQPVEIINGNYVKVILNDEQQGYMNITRYTEDVIRKDDKLSYKLYKGYIGIIQELPLDDKGAIFVLIVAILLIVLDKWIDEILSKFIRPSRRYSIVKLILPLTLFLAVNWICQMIDGDQYFEILINGVGFLPKSGTNMYYVMYFSTFIFVVLSIAVIINIFMGYSFIVAVFKLIEVFILGNIFGFMSLFAIVILAFIICGIFIIPIVNSNMLPTSNRSKEYY